MEVRSKLVTSYMTKVMTAETILYDFKFVFLILQHNLQKGAKMTKEEWLQKVHSQLINLSPESREKVLAHYEELFSIAKANGKDESEIIAMLYELDSRTDSKQFNKLPLTERLLLGSSRILEKILFFIGPFVVIIAIIIAFYQK